MEERLLEALKNIIAIVHDSEGVAGYHLNGNIAEWDEFEDIITAYNLINECAGKKLTREQNNALLPDVSKRSELLRFCKWYSTAPKLNDKIIADLVDEYLAQ